MTERNNNLFQKYLNNVLEFKKNKSKVFNQIIFAVLAIIIILSSVIIYQKNYNYTDDYLKLKATYSNIDNLDVETAIAKAKELEPKIQNINCEQVDENYKKECKDTKSGIRKGIIEAEERLKIKKENEAKTAKAERERKELEEKRLLEKKAYETDIEKFKTFKEYLVVEYDKLSSKGDVVELYNNSVFSFDFKSEKSLNDVNKAAKVFLPIIQEIKSKINFECDKTDDSQKEICRLLVKNIDSIFSIKDKYFDKDDVYKYSKENFTYDIYSEILKVFKLPKSDVALILEKS
jgi:hypothetical protein